MDKENTDTEYFIIGLSVLGNLVNHLCGKMLPFPKRQTSCLLILRRNSVGHILARPVIFPRIWKDKGITKSLTLKPFPLIVALPFEGEKK